MGRVLFLSFALVSVSLSAPLLDFVTDYCIDCHGDGTTKGGLDLGEIFEADPGKHWEIWEHAILRMDTRQMPPPKKDRPTDQEYEETLYPQFDSIIVDLAEKYKVPYLNFFESDLNIPLHDGHHLFGEGAEVFTLRLVEELRQIPIENISHF